MRSQAEWLEMNNWPVAGLILEDEHKEEQTTREAAVGEWATFIEKETRKDERLSKGVLWSQRKGSGWSIWADHTGRPSRWCSGGVRH